MGSDSIISELRTMKAITAVILLSSVLYGEACIHCPHRGYKPNKPTTTTTDYPTTPDYQDSTTAEYDANVIDRAAIREKSSEECANLEALEQLAFENCPRAAVGFSLHEVEYCKEKFKDMSFEFEMPSKADFGAMEAFGNNDGMLTMQEWKNYVQC